MSDLIKLLESAEWIPYSFIIVGIILLILGILILKKPDKSACKKLANGVYVEKDISFMWSDKIID